jgi:hypothetical protein
VILDESQNLTASQLKTIITRCGEGTKLICLGYPGIEYFKKLLLPLFYWSHVVVTRNDVDLYPKAGTRNHPNPNMLPLKDKKEYFLKEHVVSNFMFREAA